MGSSEYIAIVTFSPDLYSKVFRVVYKAPLYFIFTTNPLKLGLERVIGPRLACELQWLSGDLNLEFSLALTTILRFQLCPKMPKRESPQALWMIGWKVGRLFRDS